MEGSPIRIEPILEGGGKLGEKATTQLNRVTPTREGTAYRSPSFFLFAFAEDLHTTPFEGGHLIEEYALTEVHFQ